MAREGKIWMARSSSNVALLAGSGLVSGTPVLIPTNYFGIHILGPIETNISGSGRALVWPTWSPTAFRALDNFGGVPPGFTYTQGISQWSAVETSDGTYDWSLFDLVWAKLIAQGVTDVIFGLQAPPQWALVGNTYSFSCTIAASTGVITATGHNFVNGIRAFFTGGTTGPFTAGTIYYVVNVSGSTFQLSLTSGGSAITGGSSGSSTVTAYDTPPANMAKLTDWVTSYLTRATLDGLPIKAVENINEPNNGPGFYIGTIAQLVTMQQTIYNAAKAFDPTIKVGIAPVNSIGGTAGGTVNQMTPSSGIPYLNAFFNAGGGAYCDFINYHGYPSGATPEFEATSLGVLAGLLSTWGLSSLPIWNTEYSSLTGVIATDTTWLAVTSLISWSSGVTRQYYYDYDNGPDFLWDYTQGSSGALNAAGTAYAQVYNWMTGTTINEPASNAGVVWTVGLQRKSGYTARAVWTSDGSTPSYTVPSWAIKYRDLTGTIFTGLGATITLGRNPILFESS